MRLGEGVDCLQRGGGGGGDITRRADGIGSVQIAVSYTLTMAFTIANPTARCS